MRNCAILRRPWDKFCFSACFVDGTSWFCGGRVPCYGMEAVFEFVFLFHASRVANPRTQCPPPPQRALWAQGNKKTLRESHRADKVTPTQS